MKKIFILLSSAFLLLMTLFSCDKNKGDENDNNDKENDKKENVYYNVLSDEKLPSLDFVEYYFSNFNGDASQLAMMKDILVNSLNNYTNRLKVELGTQDIKLAYRKVNFSYKSIAADGAPLELSSTVLWRGYFTNDTVWHDIAPENVCLMEHYTITSDAECPTQSFPLELFVTGNNLTIMPDYIGYGITRDMPHPYLNHDVCAQNSIDALPAGFQLFEDMSSADMKPNWKLCVMGASQGGANALAIHRYMDTHDEFADKWNFAYSFAAAGPHNPHLTIEKYLEDGKVAYPVALPFTINSMLVSYPYILGKYDVDDLFTGNYLKVKDTVDRMLLSKNYTTSEINEVFYNNVRTTVDDNLADDEIYLTDIFSDVMFDKESDFVNDLYKCLDKNDLTKGWTPKHPIKIFYSRGDRTVPFENSVAVYDAFGSDLVTVTETPDPIDHFMTCGLWMAKVLIEGL